MKSFGKFNFSFLYIRHCNRPIKKKLEFILYFLSAQTIHCFSKFSQFLKGET